MIGNNIEYIQAYTEMKCLLKYFPIDYIKKIPTKLLEFIYKNSDEKYNIEVDLKKDLKNQNISKKTKVMLAVLTYNYWSNESEKQKIIEQLNENEKKYQEELREKYNPDNIFENKATKLETVVDSIAMVEYKETFFTKIKNWFKRILLNKIASFAILFFYMRYAIICLSHTVCSILLFFVLFCWKVRKR